MRFMQDPESFDDVWKWLLVILDFYGQKVDNGEWQAKQGTPFDRTIEVMDSGFAWPIPPGAKTLQAMVEPNLPWAEDHFLERISGEPLNPPPSHEWWPFNIKANEEHRPDGEKFSHTYPERFWPSFANVEGNTIEGRQVFVPHVGIRFEYGDLNDLIGLLVERPNTRQAYLPIWFPEDLRATAHRERVPCSLGYHFMIRRNKLSCRYYMRSCDLFRHFRDDVYMAARLTQYVASEVSEALGHDIEDPDAIKPGELNMYISSLHIFADEKPRLQSALEDIKQKELEDKNAKLSGWLG